ncbi:uncharacterized protein B0J16DRAFT_331337 [Fusarium flagelliforme]|uniref:uncharacterized protein n=1 Tax=Fusarium flagelliforme TaxID=2675880 RepID=UPI001E8E998A|nr:uncharacterized protein B0J16DRAFT_331337 [Fusarium flagelliforme]KAH7198908.1 hypothetical protein B0J16DRAFT_331337 [Fusarium flagelliforme]
MAVTTALQKYVREHVLVTWLTETFGERDTGVWSIEEIVGGRDGTWKVTAPEAITEGQQTTLAERSQPKRALTFGAKK